MPDPVDNWLGALASWTNEELAAAAGDRDQSAVAALLTCLYYPDIAVGEFASLLHMTGSGAVRLVDRLENDGLMRRRSTGGRSVSVRLTTAGRREAGRLAQRRAERLSRMLDVLAPAERQVLSGLLTKLLHGGQLEPDVARTVCRFCDHGRCDGDRCPIGTSLAERGHPRPRAERKQRA